MTRFQPQGCRRLTSRAGPDPAETVGGEEGADCSTDGWRGSKAGAGSGACLGPASSRGGAACEAGDAPRVAADAQEQVTAGPRAAVLPGARDLALQRSFTVKGQHLNFKGRVYRDILEEEEAENRKRREDQMEREMLRTASLRTAMLLSRDQIAADPPGLIKVLRSIAAALEHVGRCGSRGGATGLPTRLPGLPVCWAKASLSASLPSCTCIQCECMRME